MPTYGWVREGDWERFLSATEWPPDPTGPRRANIVCPICGHTFETSAAFQAHVIDRHHIAPPLLLIRGREPRAAHLVRSQLRTSDVVVANATSAEVQVDRRGWERIASHDLGRHLSALTLATVGVRLVNAAVKGVDPAVREYRIPFHVANAAELKAVEEAFAEYLTTDDVRSLSVADFLADARCRAGGSDYAEGLAAYVLGVLVKEQSPDRVRTPLARYRDHYNTALDRLSVHARPLPYLICMLMRFGLNTFVPSATLTGYQELDVAMALLNGPGPSLPNPSLNPAATLRKVCPVDHGTGRILDLALRLAREERWGPVLRDECAQVAEAPSLDLADREKATALWALTAWRLGRPDEAAEPLTRIASVHPFSSWAAPCLAKVRL